MIALILTRLQISCMLFVVSFFVVVVLAINLSLVFDKQYILLIEVHAFPRKMHVAAYEYIHSFISFDGENDHDTFG